MVLQNRNAGEVLYLHSLHSALFRFPYSYLRPALLNNKIRTLSWEYIRKAAVEYVGIFPISFHSSVSLRCRLYLLHSQPSTLNKTNNQKREKAKSYQRPALKEWETVKPHTHQDGSFFEPRGFC